MQNILVVVDMQNDFIDGALGTREAVAIVPKVEAKIRGFAGPVLFTRDTHEEDYMETQEGKNLPVPHCIKGTAGWEICDQIRQIVDLSAAKIYEKVTFVGEVANFVDQIKESLPEATILSSLPSAQLIGRLGLSLPSVDVDAFVPYYLKRVEAEENWLKTHEETNRDNYIKRV